MGTTLEKTDLINEWEKIHYYFAKQITEDEIVWRFLKRMKKSAKQKKVTYLKKRIKSRKKRARIYKEWGLDAYDKRNSKRK